MDFLSARGESVHQLQFGSLLTIISNNTEEFPSGQREQTVNLSAMPSVVRIHPLPPIKVGYRTVSDFYFCTESRTDYDLYLSL